MRKYQQGLSYWSVVFGVSFFAFLLKAGATIGPVYLDYYTFRYILSRNCQVNSE